uniref:Uncharacterized protein n=1 Tax=uncultured marine virus TaxID=186617 RepID=A0A0F7L6B5_9VIRU|nr:hypothetical protein [uncultured marine virus]
MRLRCSELPRGNLRLRLGRTAARMVLRSPSRVCSLLGFGFTSLLFVALTGR